MPFSTRCALLLLILSIAAFLRIYRFTSIPPGLYRDEAMDGSNALEVLETGRFQVFYPEDGGREGLYVNVAAVCIRFLGNEAWALRLPAAIFGILTVWGIYLLTTELASVEIALLAAFLLATSFWYIIFSRIAFRAIGAPLFLTWALYFLLVAIRRWREGRPHVGITLLAGMVYGLGFYTYIAYRATPLLVGAVLFYGGRKAVRLTALFAGVATLTALPLTVYFIHHPGAFLGRTAQVSILHARHPVWELVLNLWRTGRMFFTRGDINWRHNIAWRAELFWPVAFLLVVGVVFGNHAALRRLALVWLGVAAFPVILSADLVPHALRAILMIPPVSMLAASGAHRLYRWLATKAQPTWLRAGSAAFLIVLACEPYYTYFDRWAKDPHVAAAFDAPAVQLAGQINRLPREMPKYVVAPDDMAAQPVMFLTGSYTEKQQLETSIHYIVNADCGRVASFHPEARVFCLGSVP